jgi:BMFP domain-containing protein YqiC
MGATIEQLHHEMGNLRKTTAEVGQALRQTLVEYFAALDRAAQKQIVLSSFHLCTEVYPEAFLERSVFERETLQQSIRQVGRQVAESLVEILRTFQNLDLEGEADPVLVLEAWEELEDSVTELLREHSRRINYLLRDAQIMQIKSLNKLLDSADKATATGRTITNPPHLLKALVDPDEDEDSLDPVVALYLQLGDLEFTDPELMSWRQKLRPLLQKLSQLQQRYSQKQEERLTAEAISAWKATWVAEDTAFGGTAT